MSRETRKIEVQIDKERGVAKSTILTEGKHDVESLRSEVERYRSEKKSILYAMEEMRERYNECNEIEKSYQDALDAILENETESEAKTADEIMNEMD